MTEVTESRGSNAFDGRLNIGGSYQTREMAEKIPGWLERVLLPQISEVKGELKAINARMDGEFRAVHSEISRLDEKIDSVDAKLTTRIDAVESNLTTRIDSVESRLTTRIDALDVKLSTKVDELEKRMDMTQRLAVVEEQVKELRTRS